MTTEHLHDSTDETVGKTATAASHTGKYRQLWRWLQDQGQDEAELTFSDVEQVLGIPLPPSARNHLPHWYGYEGTALGRAIRDAGWRASRVNLTDETLVFVRSEAESVKEMEPGR